VRLLLGESFGWPDGDLANVWLRAWSGLTGNDPPALTALDTRVFRIVLAALVGIALASSGVALQALLRNPLAEPFILGLSTGAIVGVLLWEWFARAQGVVLWPQHLGALAGAAMSMAIVYAASRRHGTLDPLGLLLVGVVLSTINGAVVMFLHYVMSGPSPPVSRWMMGGLNEALDAPTVWVIMATIAAGGGVLLRSAPSMDVATFSDAEAQSLGVNLPRLRTILFAVASLLAAAGVVLAGPLAFVGFICPHLARMLFGPAHRVLLCASALIGVMLMLGADMVTIGIDLKWNLGQLPLGIFTAVVGGVVFLWMLRSKLGGGVG
jgi:iron complex transport system permease protein